MQAWAKGPVMEPLRGPFLGIEERGNLRRGRGGGRDEDTKIASCIRPLHAPPPTYTPLQPIARHSGYTWLNSKLRLNRPTLADRSK